MYSIIVKTDFKAQHQLVYSDGSREPLHGHKWQVSVSLSRPQLDPDGLVMDFNEVLKKINGLISPFSGGNLADFFFFKDISPSAERVAEYIFTHLQDQIPSPVKIDYVQVTEARNCLARFSRP